MALTRDTEPHKEPAAASNRRAQNHLASSQSTYTKQ